MKRPLFLLLIGLVLGELCGYWLYVTGVIIPASLLCLILFFDRIHLRGKPFLCKKIIISFLMIILLGNLSWCHESGRIRSIESYSKDLSGENCILQGKVTDRKDKENGTVRLTLLNPRIQFKDRKYVLKGKCLCTVRAGQEESGEESLFPGSTICARASLSLPKEAGNPGAFPERTYDYANGIYCKAGLSRIISVDHPVFSIRRWAYKVKKGMENGYQRYLAPEDSAVLCAMVLGDKSGLDRDQRKLYEENGLVHLLAVSGLHVSGIGGRIYRRLRKKGFSYTVSCICGGSLLIFYACMTGFAASVIRAAGMYLVFLLSEYLGRPYDLISAMSLTGVLMIL
ncbi:MAG: ComEC/Rec2 family competence protein, partial [Eubacterium sp.]|nr:ComEC/Rec2 family competence protein [Eubacterium sp.]